MRRSVCAITSALVLVVVGCGGGGGNRSSVSRYINRVNQVESQMKRPLKRMVEGYALFTSHGASPAVIEARLAHAEQTLRTLHDRIARLNPPPQARKLHGLLLALVGDEADFAGEVNKLVAFQPRFHAVLQQLRPANALLSRDLAAAKTPKPHVLHGTRKQIKAARAAYARAFVRAAKAQAAAIDSYRERLRVALVALRALSPPNVMRPAWETEVTTLERLRATGAALATALRNKRYARVRRLNLQFSAAARSGGTVSAQRAEITAVKSYNAKVRAMNALAGRIQREQQRLERTLG